MKTNLIFEIYNKNSCEHIVLTDMSQYNPDVPITDAQINITIPNFNKFVTISYNPKNVTIVNSIMLKLSDTIDCLPSGLYEFRFSVCPNDKLFKVQYFLNICTELKRIADIACDIINNCSTCSLSHLKETDLEKLYFIRQGFLTAKDMAEQDCADCKEKAIWMYNELVKQLNNL